MAAAPAWRAMSFDDRAAILLKAADLLAGPWRARINAATMLGQSKTAYQAEIDSACEAIDFWRFNVHFGRQIIRAQPMANSRGLWNHSDYRSLEGFVYAVTPFNFTAIAGNLTTAPALMGNTVVWKSSHNQALAAQALLIELLEEAGMPPGVINLVTGHGSNVSDVVLSHPEFAGLHFTGSTRVFQMFWREIGANIESGTGITRGSWGRPAARTLSSPTRARTSTFCGRRWSAAPSSTRARSVRPPPGRPGLAVEAAAGRTRRVTNS